MSFRHFVNDIVQLSVRHPTQKTANQSSSSGMFRPKVAPEKYADALHPMLVDSVATLKDEFAKVVKCAVAVVFFYSLASSAVAQNKPIVAVSNIESSFRDYDTSNIQTAIETAIVQSGKYSLMERGRLDELRPRHRGA